MLVGKAWSSLRLALCCATACWVAGSAGAQVKLSQIYGSGGNTGAPLFSDFIEIYNAGGAGQDLTGWSVQYASSTGTTWTVTALPATVLAPGQYLLVQEGTGGTLAAGQVPANPTAQATGTIAMSGTDAKVALVNVTTALTGGTPTAASIVDFVGIGTLANWNEPATTGGGFLAANNAPPMSTTHAIYRNDCGNADTADGNSDWAVGLPAPRNTATAVNAGITSIGTSLPLTAEELQTLHLTATPFRCGTVDLGAGTTVTIDLTGIGGGAATAMVDDGTSGDDLAGDGIYTVDAVIAAATAPGTKNLPVAVADGGGNSGGTYISVVVTATANPDNDNCFGAAALAVPSSTAGTYTGATAESNPFLSFSSAPTTGMGARRGLWYTVTGTGNTMTASLCATLPALDSVIAVMCGTCDGLTVISSGDDNGPACATSQASAAWCSVLGQTYYVWIAPFASTASTAPFVLDITDSGVACGTAIACTTCTGVAGPYSEVEPGYGRNTNDGCASSPNLFTTIAAPSFPATVLRGTARGYISNRDVDAYRFLATTSDTISITINTLGTNAQAQFQSLGVGGTCPAVSIANTPIFVARCVSGIQNVSSAVTAGTWYQVQVVGGIGIQQGPTAGTVFGGQMPGGRTYQYELSIQIGGPPLNDNCASANTLALGGTAAGNTSQATNDGTSSCDAIGRDVWYTITTTVAGKLHINTCGSAIDTVVTLYSTCGGAEIACNDDAGGCVCSGPASAIDFPAIAPGTYRLRVSDKLIGGGGAFTVRALFDATAAGNDACCDAVAIAVPSTTAGTTVAATAENPLPPACAGPLPGGAQSFTYTNGVWYSLSVGSTQTVTLDTLASAYDSKIWVFDASAGCSTLVCVNANDDIQGTPFQSKVAFVATAGVPYRVLVAPFGATTGSFTLTAAGDATPANDLCANAEVLSGGSGSVSGTTVGATAFINTATTANPSCQPTSGVSSYSMFAVWYSYTAACTGNVTFNTCGSYDTILSVHNACPTTTANNQVTGACNLNGIAGCTPGSSVTVALTASQTVLIRVAGEIGAAANGAFTLTYAQQDTDGDLTPDCTDGCPLDPAKIAPGVCGCGVSDVDTDGDLTPDCNDGCPLDPLKIAPGACGCGVSDVDTDGDLTPDCNDGCPLDPLKIAPGVCGCGVSDVDTDGDLTPDCNDGCPLDPLKIAPGACGCGVSDVDTDGDLTPDCNDGCPTDPLKIAPGQCGCFNPDTDTDGDLTADCNDGCPTDPLKIAPGQCGCFVADTDTDFDGVADCNDNCDTIANPGQEDCDLDNDGDVCEIFNATASDLNGNNIPDNCEPGVIPYCTAGTSVNGCSATMTTIGTPSASQPNGFFIVTTGNDGQRNGQFFYGISGPQATPFSAGFKCVAAPTQRMGSAVNTGGTIGSCNGAMFIDANVYSATHPSALGMPLTTGLTYYYQAYNRDPASPNPGLLMSSSVAVTYLP